MAEIMASLKKLFAGYSMWFLLVLLYLGLGLLIPSILTPVNLQNIIVQGTVVGCLSLGMAFVILVGNIDLSMIAIAGFAPLIGIYSMEILGFPFFAGIIVALLTGASVGLFNGLMVEKVKIPSLIQTLISWWIFWGLVLILTGGEVKSTFSPEWNWVGTAWVGPIRAVIILFVLVVVIVCLFASYSKTGLRFYLTGGNRVSAQAAGINTSNIVILAFVTSGTMAAIAGYILSARLGLVSPRFAEEWFMPAIAAPVISGFSLTGGRGNFINVIAGAYIVQIIVVAVRLAGLGGWYEQLTQGLLILIAVLIDIFRKRMMGIKA